MAATEKCPRCGGVVMLGVSMPNCLKCKNRWLGMRDLRSEQEAARKKGKNYILDGTLHDDLQELITLTQLKTMAETSAHLRNAHKQFQELHRGDGTAMPAIRAVEDIIKWLDNWHTEVKSDFEQKQKDRGKGSGEEGNA